MTPLLTLLLNTLQTTTTTTTARLVRLALPLSTLNMNPLFGEEHSSFFQDFVPRLALLQSGLQQGATLATKVLTGLASVDADHPPAFEYPTDSESVDANRTLDCPVSLPQYTARRISPTASSMASSSNSTSSSDSTRNSPSTTPLTSNPPVIDSTATVLPLAKDINVKDVKDYDGSPADLSLFDTQIENALDRWDISAYCGSCVTGNAQLGFEFVPASTPGCLLNYRLGGKLCSGLCNKFTGAAAQWWDDYTKSGKTRPN